jgi:hypothetical protein
MLDRNPDSLRQALGQLGLAVTDRLDEEAIVVTGAAQVRGHERKAMIVITRDLNALRRNCGVAIDAYIAMSRAVQRLIVLEVS